MNESFSFLAIININMNVFTLHIGSYSDYKNHIYSNLNTFPMILKKLNPERVSIYYFHKSNPF